MPGEVSGRSVREGESVGMARKCRGLRVVLGSLCLSYSFLSVMDIFSGFQMPANSTAMLANQFLPIDASKNI
jgi:hypothetical protein